MQIVLLALDPNEPAPSWMPIVALAIPVVIIAAVLIPALRYRARHKKAMRRSRGGVGEDSVALGSSASISDGATYSVDGLRKALAVKPEDHGPTDSEPHDEGWAGTMLGLRSKMSTATEVLEPHVYWGRRELGQVFVRIGPDEEIEGGTMLGSNRHIRQITVLRVAAPEFKLDVIDGVPAVVEGAAPGIENVFSRMAQAAEIWQDAAAQGGPEGIVISRGAITSPDFWIYDLWLLEAIARQLRLRPLDDARIGPAWRVPYGIGRQPVSTP
ncbi:MAG: hypothetical protein JHC98_07760 [Thermoleophilaceae bacterium]|nr:hypothetical protein [Thermoleophilaceae bacterium]